MKKKFTTKLKQDHFMKAVFMKQGVNSHGLEVEHERVF